MKRVDVIFTVQTPLHIGYLPFRGSVVSATRYYIPGKNFWGAITKRVTEYLFDKPKPENYRTIGLKIKNMFTFSYFYLYDRKNVYIPNYTNEGLIFGYRNKINKYRFEQKFISGRVVTAINAKNKTAKDESLHEIEYIKSKFKDEYGKIQNTKIVGCIWIDEDQTLNDKKVIPRNNGLYIDDFNIIEQLTLGGELNYGFGLVKLDKIVNEKIIPLNEHYNENSENTLPKVYVKLKKDETILSHLEYDKEIIFNGDIELLSGRGYFNVEKAQEKIENGSEKKYKEGAGKAIVTPRYFFSPGTRFIGISNEDSQKNEAILEVKWNGTLKRL